MTALRLIPGDAQLLYQPVPPMTLHAHSRRPGLAHEELDLHLDRSQAEHAGRIASSEGIPLGLCVVIAIESQRVVRSVATAERLGTVVSQLNWVAHRGPQHSSRVTRLAAYAAALRGASPRQQPAAIASKLDLLVPYHTLVAWGIASDETGINVKDWALEQLLSAGPRRRLWEAASAEAGQTLAEWIALQAAAGLVG